MIREDYLAICDMDHCAAAILNVFEYWTNIKLGQKEQAEIENRIAAEGNATLIDTELWIYKSVAELQEELMGLFGETKISTALKMLETKGYVNTRNNPKYGWDRTIQYLFNTKTIQSVILRNGVLDFKKSKSQKKGMTIRKSKDAIPKTTSKTTQKDSLSPGGDGKRSNPMYDAVLAVWGYTEQLNGLMAGVLKGTAKRKGWKEFNLSKPVTADEVMAWADWYRRTELHGDKKLNMLAEPVKVQSSITRWQELGMPTNGRSPATKIIPLAPLSDADYPDTADYVNLAGVSNVG